MPVCRLSVCLPACRSLRLSILQPHTIIKPIASPCSSVVQVSHTSFNTSHRETSARQPSTRSLNTSGVAYEKNANILHYYIVLLSNRGLILVHGNCLCMLFFLLYFIFHPISQTRYKIGAYSIHYPLAVRD